MPCSIILPWPLNADAAAAAAASAASKTKQARPHQGMPENSCMMRGVTSWKHMKVG